MILFVCLASAAPRMRFVKVFAGMCFTLVFASKELQKVVFGPQEFPHLSHEGQAEILFVFLHPESSQFW